MAIKTLKFKATRYNINLDSFLKNSDVIPQDSQVCEQVTMKFKIDRESIDYGYIEKLTEHITSMEVDGYRYRDVKFHSLF